MKIISLSEAKTHLSRYGRLCQKEPIIVTVNGAPAFELVPLGADDDIIDRLLEHNPAFSRTLKRRLKERAIGAKDAARLL
ncbi:MAG TPA: type II toxin-antitoxin system Phd/YefM family antitoxin [Isosphaeraceae bacterium]|jgi:antitoxin (DNA-binding transcriptional repressor) of toxin-antitoxin stability system|nr:type II toxin-antitoxin system Phd/YefM family antitoxin [Isosphaeraceae bacterium]